MAHGLESFLHNIWGDEEGTVFFAQKKTEDLFKVSSPVLWPKHKESIFQFISSSNTNWDTYFTPGIFKIGSTSKEKDNGWRTKSLWADLDGYKDGLSTAEEALTAIRGTGWLPEPTYRVQTSARGEHWYWVLEDYIDAATANNINRRLAYFLGADKACWDISHVMRPPETHNHKPERKLDGISPSVTIAHFSGEIHSIETFEKLPPIKEQITDLLISGPIPDVQDVIMTYPWDKTHTELFRRDKEHFWDEEKQDYTARGNAMVRLSYFGAEIGMPDNALFSVLSDADDRWGKFKDRNDRTKQLVDMIAKVRLKYPHALITEYTTGDTELKAVYGFTDFLATTYEFKWLYENMVPQNGINFISARPGVGKSRFILQLAMCLALGKDFLGWKIVGGPRKILLMSLEMGRPVLKRFMESLAADSELTEEELKTLNTNFLVVPAGEPLAINSAEGEQFLRKVVGEYDPDVIFIDAMGSLDIEELNEGTSKKIMNKLKSFLNEWDITFYLVHHNKKTDAASINKPPTLNDFYGNTYAATDAASIMALWENPANGKAQRELHTLKHRIGLEPKPLILKSRKFIFELENDDEQWNPAPATPRSTPSTKPTEAANKSFIDPFGFGV